VIGKLVKHALNKENAMKLLFALTLLFGSMSFAIQPVGRVSAAAVFADFRSVGTGVDLMSRNVFESLFQKRCPQWLDHIQRTAVFVGTDCQSFMSATEQDLSKY
jgi:hypothetical protein